MSDTIINRANSKIGASDFVKLTQLHLDYEWLTYEPEALFELWCLSENNEQQDLTFIEQFKQATDYRNSVLKKIEFFQGNDRGKQARTKTGCNSNECKR